MDSSTAPTIEPFVGIDEAAAHLGVPKSWLYQRGDAEGVPCARVGQKRRYRLSRLTEWAESNSQAAA